MTDAHAADEQVAIRPAAAADMPAITAIDAEGLATGHATFRAEPHNTTSFTAAFGDPGFALVAERAGAIVAWAGIAPTSARAVYRGVGEVSIYVAGSARGRGVGRLLLTALVAASERAGYWTLVAQVFPENAGSVAFHEAAEFRTVGVRERLGPMEYGSAAGRWRDVVMLERRSAKVGWD